ncbi:MAG: ABC transporter permease [Bacteroidota bacterium]
MKYQLIFKLSKALLLARVKQTSVAAIGVTFSIMMFIALLSFMTGLNDLLDGLVINRTPHVRLFNELKPALTQPVDKLKLKSYHFIHSVKPKASKTELYNVASISTELSRDPRVLGISPRITTPIFYNIGNTNLSGVINGLDVVKESELFSFSDYVVEGKELDLKNVPNSIILGKGVAEKMLVTVGDVISITTPNGEQFSLKVVGFFQSGLLDLDKVQSYASVSTTQKLIGASNDYITDLQVKLKNILLAPALAKEYAKRFELDAIDIQTANSQFETGSSVRTIISYAVGITLLIVAGFGIYNILNMMIYEKMDSIAIMKATGFSGRDVRYVFITIALSIGLVGGLLGLLFGYGLSALIDQIPFNTMALPTIKTYPINYSFKFYLIGAIFSVITTYLAGYFPSRKASRIDPVVIIRGK